MLKAGEVKIERKGGCRVENKRLNIPYLLTWKCIKCGKQHEHDYSEGYYYLSYPTWGKAQEIYLYCDACEYEMPILITVDLSCKVEWEETP